MKTTLLSILVTLVIFTAQAQVTKKLIELPEFKNIYVNSNYTVYLKQNNKQEVTVEALTDIYSVTEIKVENGVLLINVDRKPDNPNKSLWAKIDDIKLNPTMKVYVSLKNVNELKVNGGGKIISENSIASENLDLSVSGNGSIDLDIKGNVVKTRISGSGSISLKGYATSNDIELSGSGNLNAFSFELERAKIEVSGSGSADINATSNLDAMIMGAGSVKHKGNTKNVTKKLYGAGTVDRAY